MPVAVRIPKLGLSDYADLVAWEVDEGERVEEGGVVAVLESDKASAEIEAPASGVVLAHYVEEGEEIALEVGKPLAVIGEQGESPPSPSELVADEAPEGTGDAATGDAATGGGESRPSPPERAESASDPDVTPRARRRAREEGVDLPAVDGTGPRGAITEDDVERHLAEGEEAEEAEADSADGTAPDSERSTSVVATPRARRRAAESDVDLASVEGTGPEGAVTEDDVESFASSDGEATQTDSAAREEEDLTVVESRTLSGVRRTVAERLSESAREKPHVMGTRDIGVERLEAVRDRLVEERGLDVSLNDLLLHFVGRTLEDLPEFNARFEAGEHRLIDEVNVGYAVDGEKGLVVPVVTDVPDRPLPELASERRRLVDAVLNDDHQVADLQGGTFTVTNVGVFDMDVSYSIINPPQVAILAVGRRKPVPVERDGDVAFERAITFSLTIDHRVLDGADSGAFLNRLAEYLEFPGRALDAV